MARRLLIATLLVFTSCGADWGEPEYVTKHGLRIFNPDNLQLSIAEIEGTTETVIWLLDNYNNKLYHRERVESFFDTVAVDVRFHEDQGALTCPDSTRYCGGLYYRAQIELWMHDKGKCGIVRGSLAHELFHFVLHVATGKPGADHPVEFFPQHCKTGACRTASLTVQAFDIGTRQQCYYGR